MSKSKLEFVISSKWDGKGTSAAQADLGKLTRTAQQATAGSEALGESYSQLALFAERDLSPALNEAQGETEKLGRKARAAKEDIDGLGQESRKTKADVDGLGQESRKTKKEVDGLGEGSRKTKEDVDGLGRKSEESSKKVGKLGEIARGTLVPALGAAVIAAGAAGAALIKMAVDASVEFESSFAGIVKTVDGLVDAEGRLNREGEALRQQFRDMAQEIPVSVNALAGIGELGGQLGIAKADLLSFTEIIAKIAVTTNLTEEDAATSFAQIANVMNGSQEDVARFASSLVALGNSSATTESQIMDFASRIAGAGAVAKLSMADVGGIGAAYSSIGIQAEAGGTAVQDALLKMNEAVATGNDSLAIFAATAGLSIEEFSRLWREDAAEAFTLFVEGLGQQGDQASMTLDKVELGGANATRSFLGMANAGSLLRDSIATANEAFAENNALNAEAEQRFKTRESQLQLLSNKFTDVAITLGDKLGPTLDVLIERTGVWLDAFAEFMETETFNNFVTNVTRGISFISNQMADQTRDMVHNNATQAQSVEELEREFGKLISVRAELDKMDPFANTLTQESTEIIVRRLAEVTGSTQEFEEAIRSLHQKAMEAGEVGSFNVYEVLGAENEWADYFKQIQGQIEAASFDQRLTMRVGVSVATEGEGVSPLEQIVSGMDEEMDEAGQEAAERYDKAFRAGLGQSASLFSELFAAQKAMAEAEGGWEESVLDHTEEIATIQRQLSRDLTDEQERTYSKLLEVATEGGAEWQGLWTRLQEDLTTTQRNELVARLADLQEQHGSILRVHTGDAEAAEEASARIVEAQAAIRESYRETAFEKMVGSASLADLPMILAWAEEQGIIEEGEAELRLGFAQTMAAIDARTAALANGEVVNDDFLESVTLLTSGLFESEQQAIHFAEKWDAEVVGMFMEASEEGGNLEDVLRRINFAIEQLPTTVSIAVRSDLSQWNLPTEVRTPTTVNRGQWERPGYAAGGRVRGGVHGRDSVSALLMPDEYVLTADTARAVGYDALDNLNRTGTWPGSTSSTGSIHFENHIQIVTGDSGQVDMAAIEAAVRRAQQDSAHQMETLLRSQGVYA